jgi:hypothetical protein
MREEAAQIQVGVVGAAASAIAAVPWVMPGGVVVVVAFASGEAFAAVLVIFVVHWFSECVSI